MPTLTGIRRADSSRRWRCWPPWAPRMAVVSSNTRMSSCGATAHCSCGAGRSRRISTTVTAVSRYVSTEKSGATPRYRLVLHFQTRRIGVLPRAGVVARLRRRLRVGWWPARVDQLRDDREPRADLRDDWRQRHQCRGYFFVK